MCARGRAELNATLLVSSESGPRVPGMPEQKISVHELRLEQLTLMLSRLCLRSSSISTVSFVRPRAGSFVVTQKHGTAEITSIRGKQLRLTHPRSAVAAH